MFSSFLNVLIAVKAVAIAKLPIPAIEHSRARPEENSETGLETDSVAIEVIPATALEIIQIPAALTQNEIASPNRWLFMMMTSDRGTSDANKPKSNTPTKSCGNHKIFSSEALRAAIHYKNGQG
jgi:hypothetical protein